MKQPLRICKDTHVSHEHIYVSISNSVIKQTAVLGFKCLHITEARCV